MRDAGIQYTRIEISVWYLDWDQLTRINMRIRNPVLIQDGLTVSRPRNSSPPLFLIHDASGLISAYFKLGLLGVPVYGLYDPKFDDNGLGSWQDVQHISEHYVRLIKRQHRRGEIVLGGEWSIRGSES